MRKSGKGFAPTEILHACPFGFFGGSELASAIDLTETGGRSDIFTGRLGIDCQSRLLIRFYFVTPRSSPLRIGEPADGVFGKDRPAKMSERLPVAVKSRADASSESPKKAKRAGVKNLRGSEAFARFPISWLGHQVCFEAIHPEPLSWHWRCFHYKQPVQD